MGKSRTKKCNYKVWFSGTVSASGVDGIAGSPVPELKSSNFMQRSFGERVAMNSPIQGTAADIIKIAMIRVAERLQEEQLESRIVLQVHDELLVETKIEEKEQVERSFQFVMLERLSIETTRT